MRAFTCRKLGKKTGSREGSREGILKSDGLVFKDNGDNPLIILTFELVIFVQCFADDATANSETSETTNSPARYCERNADSCSNTGERKCCTCGNMSGNS